MLWGAPRISFIKRNRATSTISWPLSKTLYVILGEASGEMYDPMVDVRSHAFGKNPIEGGHDIMQQETLLLHLKSY